MSDLVQEILQEDNADSIKSEVRLSCRSCSQVPSRSRVHNEECNKASTNQSMSSHTHMNLIKSNITHTLQVLAQLGLCPVGARTSPQASSVNAAAVDKTDLKSFTYVHHTLQVLAQLGLCPAGSRTSPQASSVGAAPVGNSYASRSASQTVDGRVSVAEHVWCECVCMYECVSVCMSECVCVCGVCVCQVRVTNHYVI